MLYLVPAAFCGQPLGTTGPLGLGPQLDIGKLAKSRSVANSRRKPPFGAVSGASAKFGSRRKGIVSRSSGVCVQVSPERSVGMGLLRAPVMPKQTFLASESSLRNKRAGPFGAAALQGRCDRGREERGPPRRWAYAPYSPVVQSSSQPRLRTARRVVRRRSLLRVRVHANTKQW